jgi:hypothetical protein
MDDAGMARPQEGSDLMVDNQHKQISGYRDLSTEEIAIMNKLKACEKDVLALVQEVHNTPGVNARSAAIAKTEIQTGFMWAIRAIARPNGE